MSYQSEFTEENTVSVDFTLARLKRELRATLK